MMYPIMHGAHIAFYYDQRPFRGHPIDPAHAVLTDGERPVIGEAVVCGFCGKQLSPADLVPAGGFA
jgi:hypothetical protein